MATVIDELVTIFRFRTDRAGLDSMTRGVANARQSINRMSMGMGIAGTAGSLAVAGIALQGQQMGQQFSRIAASVGKDLGEIETEYKRFTWELSKQTGVNTDVIADSITKTISGGVSDPRLVRGLVDKAIRAHATQATEASTLISAGTTLQAIVGASDPSRFLDQILMAAQKGEGDPLEYSTTIKQIAATLISGYGFSPEEVLGQLSTIAQVSPSVSQGGIMMRDFWMNVMNYATARAGIMTAGDARQLISEGRWTEVFGAVRDYIVDEMGNVDMDRLRDAMPDVQGQGFFFSLAGIENPNAPRDPNAPSVDLSTAVDLIAQQENAAGTIQRAWSDAADQMHIKFGQMTTAVQQLNTVLLEAMAPTLTWIIEKFSALADAFQAAPAWIRNVVAGGLLFTASLVGVAAMLQVLSFAMGTWVTLLRVAAFAKTHLTAQVIAFRLALLQEDIARMIVNARMVTSNILLRASNVIGVRRLALTRAQLTQQRALNIAQARSNLLELAGNRVRQMGIFARVAQIALMVAQKVVTWLLFAAQMALNVAMWLNPIGLIVAGIVAAIAVIVLAIRYWGAIRDVMLAVWEVIRNALLPIWRALVDGWNQSLGPALRELWTALRGLFGAGQETGGSMEGLKTALEILFAPGIAMAKLFGITLKLAFDVLGGGIRILTRLLTGDFAGAWRSIKELVLNVALAIVKAWNAIPILPDIDTTALEQTLSSLQNKDAAIRRSELAAVPGAASGGIVRPPGGLVQVGEGGEAEAIIPLSQLSTMLAGTMRHLPVGEVPPSLLAGAGTTVNVNLTVPEIVVNAPGGDGDEIAQAISDALAAQFRDAVAAMDSPILR